MGYSIFVSCENKEKLEKIQSFIETNFTEYDSLIGQSENLLYVKTRSESYAPHSDYVSGGRNKQTIGVKAPVGSCEAYYIFRVLTWMSLKVGKLSKYKEIQLPVIFLDGDKCPIHLNESDFASTPNDGLKYTVDHTGWAPLSPDPLMSIDKATGGYKDYLIKTRAAEEEISELTKKELQRLDDLWKKG